MEYNKNNKKQGDLFASEGEFQIDLFKDKEMRKILHKGEWWFAVKDVVEAIVDTKNGTDYIGKIRKRDKGLEEGYRQIVETLEYGSNGGRQKTNFVNIEGIFRILQSIPTKKAEPFKKWLAKVGFERLEEMANPELAVKRAMAIYAAKGYTSEWIEARIQNKIGREGLTLEWKKRGIKDVQYGLLTDAISIETFGISTKTHKEVKKLGKSHSLRDNMTPIELTLTTLGEQATREIARSSDAKGLYENKKAAESGGRIAKLARLQLEEETKKSVVSEDNYLTERQRKNIKVPKDTYKKLKDIKRLSKD